MGKRNKAMRYLEVSFHDNDFGIPVTAALERLWKYVNDNNGHLTNYLPGIFYKLHESEHLSAFVRRLFVLEHLSRHIEFRTRGLHRRGLPPTNPAVPPLDKPDTVEHTNEYLKFEFRFHSDLGFTESDQNYESAAVDLETGEVKLF